MSFVDRLQRHNRQGFSLVAGARIAWVLLLVTVATFLTYLPGVNNLFAAEDFDQLAVATLDMSWARFLSIQFRPLRLVLIAMIDSLFGLNPAPHHLLTLAFHLLNVLMVYFLVRLLTGNTQQSTVAAILFAFYPRHHESILFLSAGASLQTSVFFLASIIAFLRYGEAKKAGWLFLSITTFILALSGHEMAATLPIVLLAMDHIYLERTTLRHWCVRLFKRYALYGGCLLLYAVLSVWVKLRHPLDSVGPTQGYYLTGVGIRQVKTFASYLVYIFFPQIRLRSLDIDPLTVLLSVGLVSGCVLLVIKDVCNSRFWVIWIAITLMPFVLFVPYGNADRYFYLAAVGACALLAGLGQRGYQALRQSSIVGAMALVVGLLVLYVGSSAFIIQQQIRDWRRAGTVAKQCIEQVKAMYPHLGPEARVYVADLPGRLGYASVFLGGGFEGAMRLAYGDPAIRELHTRDPIVISEIRSSASQAPPSPPSGNIYLFLYSHEKQRIVDYTPYVGALLDTLDRPVWYSYDF